MPFRRPSSLQAPGSPHHALAPPATDLLPSATLIHSLTGVASNPKCLWGCSVLTFQTLRVYIVTARIVPRATAHDKDGDLTRRCALEWSESCSYQVRRIPSMCSEPLLVVISLRIPHRISGKRLTPESQSPCRPDTRTGLCQRLPLDLYLSSYWCTYRTLRLGVRVPA